jgi:hypothetical protein
VTPRWDSLCLPRRHCPPHNPTTTGEDGQRRSWTRCGAFHVTVLRGGAQQCARAYATLTRPPEYRADTKAGHASWMGATPDLANSGDLSSPTRARRLYARVPARRRRRAGCCNKSYAPRSRGGSARTSSLCTRLARWNVRCGRNQIGPVASHCCKDWAEAGVARAPSESAVAVPVTGVSHGLQGPSESGALFGTDHSSPTGGSR